MLHKCYITCSNKGSINSLFNYYYIICQLFIKINQQKQITNYHFYNKNYVKQLCLYKFDLILKVNNIPYDRQIEFSVPNLRYINRSKWKRRLTKSNNIPKVSNRTYLPVYQTPFIRRRIL